MKNRFIVFAGDEYYPLGGWNDRIGSFSELKDVKKCLRDRFPNGASRGRGEWWHIVDLEVEAVVFTNVVDDTFTF